MLFTQLPLSLVSLAASLSFFSSTHAKSYSLSWELQGNDFMDEFDFWDSGSSSDPTSSSTDPTAAYYMPKSAAQQQGLVYITDEGNFHLGVDNTFSYSHSNLRPSVRLTSQKSFTQGLLIIDAPHLAYGQGAWPAIWLTSTSAPWPTAGEIDIYEGVGTSTQNTMSYHTSSGCSYDTTAKQTGILAKGVGTNCNALANGDQACGNVDPSNESFGSGANEGGGSVYALEWTDSAIKMWHFNRANVPSDITSGKPSPSGWGTPVTNLASTYCDLSSYFGAQSLIIDIELCGTWAGAVYPGGSQACLEFVQSNPEAFDTAYFEVASVKHYQ